MARKVIPSISKDLSDAENEALKLIGENIISIRCFPGNKLLYKEDPKIGSCHFCDTHLDRSKHEDVFCMLFPNSSYQAGQEFIRFVDPQFTMFILVNRLRKLNEELQICGVRKPLTVEELIFSFDFCSFMIDDNWSKSPEWKIGPIKGLKSINLKLNVSEIAYRNELRPDQVQEVKRKYLPLYMSLGDGVRPIYWMCRPCYCHHCDPNRYRFGE